MHKTLLAALIGASVFAVLPALAQVDLGAAGRAGAGVTAGASGAVNGVPGQLGTPPGPGLQRADRDARHATRQAAQRTRRTLDRHDRADVDAATSGSTGVRAGGQRVHADAGVRAGASASVDGDGTANQAQRAAQGIGDQVSDSAHTAIDSTDRAAGSVGDAARRTATGTSVGADARVRTKADGHGH